MPIKLNVSVCRKEGRANYGSEGATCSIEIEADASLADNPELLHAKVRSLYRLCDRAVAAQIAGYADPGPEPEHAPSPPRRPDRDPGPTRDRNGRPHQSPTPRPASPSSHSHSHSPSRTSGPPRDGRQLSAVLRKLGEEAGWDVFGHIIRWGRSQEYSGLVKDWGPSETAAAYAEALHAVNAAEATR